MCFLYIYTADSLLQTDAKKNWRSLAFPKAFSVPYHQAHMYTKGLLAVIINLFYHIQSNLLLDSVNSAWTSATVFKQCYMAN